MFDNPSGQAVICLHLGPATRRWVSLVGAVVKAEVDIPTLVPWALAFHVSVSTIKRYCKACGVHAADSLDFARGLRIVSRHAGRQIDEWYDTLEIRDPKTMARFLNRAGFDPRGIVPPVHRFAERQRFIAKTHLVEAVTVVMTSPHVSAIDSRVTRNSV